MTKAKSIPEPLLGEDGTDWSQDSLTPYYLKKGYNPNPQPPLPSVEEDEEVESEVVKQNTTLAEHMTLSERFIKETA